MLSLLGVRLSLSGGPLVAQIIVLTMPAASHLALHFRDELRQGEDRRHAAEATLRAVSVPILSCTWRDHRVPGAAPATSCPVGTIGRVLAITTAIAAILTMAISPVAMLPPMRLEVWQGGGSAVTAARGINALNLWVYRRPVRIILATLVVVHSMGGDATPRPVELHQRLQVPFARFARLSFR